MTNKLFDSFVNDKLKDYESPVPDGLWEKIIAKDEKPKIAFWWNRKIWMLGFAVFIFISGFGYLTLNKTNKSKEIIAYKQLQTQNFKGTDFSGLAVSSSNTIPASKIDEQNNIQENLKQSRKLNNETAENKTEKTRVEPLDGNKHKVLNQDVVTDFKTTLSSIKSAKNRSSLKRKATINQTFLGKQQSIIQNLKVGSGLDANFLNDESYTTHLSRENGAVLMRASDLENTNLLKEKQVLALGKLFSGVDDCPTTRGTYRNDIYLEAYVSPDIAFKNVASTKLGNDSYLQKKDSSESMRLGFTIGARFSKSITNNLLFKAGLQYSQMSERFTLRTENDRRQTIVINSHTIVRPNLPDTTISDTSVSVQIGYRIRTNMNYYRNLEIPLILSYEFGQSDESKWKIAVNAGAIVNITSWYDGKTIDAGYNLVNIGSKANNGFYKSQFGVSLYGGLSVIRSISPQLDVFAEPYFRYGLYNMQGSAGFNQRFNIAGIQVGTRLKISTHKHL